MSATSTAAMNPVQYWLGGISGSGILKFHTSLFGVLFMAERTRLLPRRHPAGILASGPALGESRARPIAADPAFLERPARCRPRTRRGSRESPATPAYRAGSQRPA